MEQFKETVTKCSPTKLVNTLLKLNEDLAAVKPEDTPLKTEIKAKIAIVQDLISKLKKDTNAAASDAVLSTDKSNDCEKLERSKSGHLAQITTLVKKFEIEFSNLETAADEDERSEVLISLDQITSSLSYQLTQVEHKTTKLELLLDEDALIDLVARNSTYSEKVFYCKSKLTAAKEHEKDRKARQAKAVLPSITIAKFTPKGRMMYSDFQTFKGSFESLFLESNFYSKIQLFNYLLSFLGGEALQLCQRFSITQSFDEAWAELTSCYDRPDLLISECLAHLESIEKPRGSAFSMRQLYLRQNQSVSMLLKFIGGSIKIDESVLMRSLLAKVPYSFDKQYREFLSEKEIERKKDLQILSLTRDIQTLSTNIGVTSTVVAPSVSSDPVSSNVQIYFNFFEKYLNNLEYLEMLHPKLMKENPETGSGRNFRERGTNLASIGQQKEKRGGNKFSKNDKNAKGAVFKFCYLCKEKGDHFTPFCKKPLNIKEKWEIFTKFNLCFNCGRKGHSGKDCKKDPACKNCSLRHLPILHYTPQIDRE